MPLIEKMAAEYHSGIFLEVDVEENVKVARKHDIDAMPTFLFIRQKEVREKFVGADIVKVRKLYKAHCPHYQQTRNVGGRRRTGSMATNDEATDFADVGSLG